MNTPRATEPARYDAGSARLSRSALALGALLALLSGALPAEGAPADEAHRQAVQAARRGDYDAALRSLSQLRQAQPDDRSLLLDQVLVLAWAGRDRDVIAAAADIDPDRDPLPVITAVAKAHRNAGQFEPATDWYALALQREPDSLDANVGLVMTLADAGQFALAETRLEGLAPALRQSVPAVQARLYLYRLAGRQVESLPLYEALLAGDPGNRQLLRDQALLMRALLLPEAALQIAAAHPGLLSPEEVHGLEADRMALSIRNAARTPYPPPDQYRGSEMAVAKLNSYLAEVAPGTPLERKLRYDRLVALADRHRATEAVMEYEALLAQDPQTPPYVRFSAARAYLEIREPDTALALLDSCLEEDPGNVDVQVQRVYALAALERHEEAIALADRLLEQSPPYQQEPGSPVIKPNEGRMQAELRAVLARAYADRLGESQQRLEAMASEAPGNTDVRHELGSIYLWRGWPDRALAQYRQALAVQPGMISARAGWSVTQIERAAFADAGREITALTSEYPDHPTVRELTRRWTLHQRSLLVVEASSGESSGTTFGSDQYNVDAWWYSRPLAQRYRLYARSHDAFGEFEEGPATRRRLAAGAEYRRPYWNARAELAAERLGGDDTGLSAELNWRIDDLWSLAASAELNGYDTPLRAYRNDIDANRLALRAAYRPDERSSVSAGLARQDFDDGNARSSLWVDGRQRLLTRPDWRVEATGGAALSRASKQDTPYFNPSRDRSLVLGADLRWATYKRFERGVYQRLHPQLGSYWQDGFGSGGTWALDYELEVHISRGWSVRAGVRRARNVYDGNREYGTFFLASLEGRL